MLEKILKLYTTSMLTGARSPIPHLYGPPGCGKSTSVEQVAQLVGKNVWTINVSRLSPLEVEGVQMPIDDNTALHMIPAAFWTRMQEGDILLLDEFLRGFPEVYNGLLDILTSRKVGAFEIPEIFIIAASNSTATYDKALSDRLLHLPAADPRKSKKEKNRIAKLIVEALGMEPEMWKAMEMDDLLNAEVLPMYEMLDQLGQSPKGQTEGSSPRNLIGQAMLREVQSSHLKGLIQANNRVARMRDHHQNTLLLNGKDAPEGYAAAARAMVNSPKLSKIQRINTQVNLQLIELEEERERNKEKEEDDDPQFI